MPTTKPELLLPAGNPEKLKYAIAYGADAIYLGLPMASLRTPSRGEQFTPENIGSYIQYAHDRNVKAYVTVNIFANNPDLKRVIPHLEQLEDLKPDALILSDPGIFRLAKKHAPSIDRHISTQANTLNVEACAFWQDIGASRIILAREVPIREIAEIHEQLPDLELEAFIHGSLCVAYSGRCVISDYLTDNSKNSNKGMCGNSCRWEFDEASNCHSDPLGEENMHAIQMKEASRPNEVYTFEEDEKGSYMLNSKDLCLVGHIKELQDAGVISLKAEGRTKSVYYVATVGKVYREAIDYFQTHTSASDEQISKWVAELSQAGNRGFTEGFFYGRPSNLAYNYQTSDTMQGSTFVANIDVPPDGKSAGKMPSISKGIQIKARNPINVGEQLEWITPEGTFHFKLTELQDKTGLPIEDLQTNQVGVIPKLPKALSHLSEDTLRWSLLAKKNALLSAAASA